MNDQYTPIHNEVLEALSKINLAPYETRVLFVIWRKTYGFIDPITKQRKKYDWIAGNQISKMTGLDRRLVYRALQGLKKKNVIVRDDNKTGFSKAFMKLMSSVEMTNGKEVVTKMMTPSGKNDDKMSSILSHTKENKRNYTKETTTLVDQITSWAYKRARVIPSCSQNSFRRSVEAALDRVGEWRVKNAFEMEENAIQFLSNIKNL